jgi:SAM-dependent methyltransferase
MRPVVKDFVGIVSKLPTNAPVYEFGSYQVNEYGNLRPYFPGTPYVGCDYRAGPGVDRVCDVHSIDLPDDTSGTVLSLDTLEHVERPHQAAAEFHRVIKPGGWLAISSVMCFPIHAYPYDYWRFTPEAFRSLLGSFTKSVVAWSGDPDFPHTIVGVGWKGVAPDTADLEAQLKVWAEKWEFPKSRMSWLQYITPPILLHLRHKARSLRGPQGAPRPYGR